MSTDFPSQPGYKKCYSPYSLQNTYFTDYAQFSLSKQETANAIIYLPPLLLWANGDWRHFIYLNLCPNTFGFCQFNLLSLTTLEFLSSFITKLEQEIEIFPDSFQIVDLIGRSLQYGTHSILKKHLIYIFCCIYTYHILIFNVNTTLNLIIK